MSDKLLAIAEREISRGRKVFPCKGKFPIIPKEAGGRGCLDATDSMEQIKEWIKQYPKMTGWGITFAADGKEVALDIDKDTIPLLDKWQHEHGILETACKPTPSGGLHFVMTKPPGMKLPNISKDKGFELKADNQYILAGGSLHPNGGVYPDFNDCEPQPIPSWFIEECRKASNNGHQTAKEPTVIKKLDQAWHSELIGYIGRMRALGHKEAEIETLALALNHESGNNPLPDNEVLDMVKQYRHQAKPQQPPKTTEREMPTVKTICDVVAEPVIWLWKPRIPKGKVTLLEGDPGVGKSWVTLAIATAVSLGGRLPGIDAVSSGPVMIARAEDGIADTIKPRLEAMGADQREIRAIDGLLTLDTIGFEMLETIIQENVPTLLIVDPLVAYLSGDLDINKANQVRFAMARLAALADKYGMAVLAVRHLTKGGNSKAIYRGLGSIDFTAAARSVLFVGSDPEDDNNRAIDHIKSNLAPKGEPIGFELRDGRFFWKLTTDLTYERMTAISEGGSALEDAKSYLTDLLSEGGMLATSVFTDAKGKGMTEITLRRAAKTMGIVMTRQGELGKKGGGKSYWTLPESGGAE